MNAGLAPAALRAIAALARAGVYPKHKQWGRQADNYAKVFEDKTLQFFEVRFTAYTATFPQKSLTFCKGLHPPDRSPVPRRHV